MSDFRTIVVGTDFTPCSAVALRQALRIALWSSVARGAASTAPGGAGAARLVVVHVIDTLVAIELEEALSPLQKGITEGLVSDAQQAWRQFASQIDGASELPIDVIISGRVAGLIRRAHRERADLLVLGAYGSAAPDVGVGTVATACVRSSMSDVLLVRDTRPDGGGSPFHKIIAAVDFSETSRRAVERAALFASRDGAELDLLHVYSAPWRRLHYRAPTPEAQPAFQRQYADALRGRLEEFCRPVLERVHGLRCRHTVIDHQGHRSGITEHAHEVGADLVVLGTRGRTNLRDIVLGTTAEKALRESRCSILAVKPEGFSHPLASSEPEAVR